MNKIVYVDLDDVLADFYKGAQDHLGEVQEWKMWNPGFFFNLKPTPGAQGSIFEIQKVGFDIWILSQPLADNPNSYLEKIHWVQIHFPQLYRKVILCQDKSLLKGHYLIDDNEKKWKTKFESTGGKFIHFPYGGYNKGSNEPYKGEDPELIWKRIVQFFQDEALVNQAKTIVE